MARSPAQVFLRNDRGMAAVELAILAPVYLSLLFGVVQGGFLILTQASLHYAVQKGVRCMALQNTCPSPETHYFSLGPTPVFSSAQLTCGQALTATVTYSLSVVLYKQDIPLSATSCFPNIKGTTS
jgi:Flp pilus assembly protein TadG